MRQRFNIVIHSNFSLRLAETPGWEINVNRDRLRNGSTPAGYRAHAAWYPEDSFRGENYLSCRNDPLLIEHLAITYFIGSSRRFDLSADRVRNARARIRPGPPPLRFRLSTAISARIFKQNAESLITSRAFTRLPSVICGWPLNNVAGAGHERRSNTDVALDRARKSKLISKKSNTPSSTNGF